MTIISSFLAIGIILDESDEARSGPYWAFQAAYCGVIGHHENAKTKIPGETAISSNWVENIEKSLERSRSVRFFDLFKFG